MRHYYATQSPRGFANEINVWQFASRADRDAWVQIHRTDGDCNSAALGAQSCTVRDAHRILARRDTNVEKFYNMLVDLS